MATKAKTAKAGPDTASQPAVPAKPARKLAAKRTSIGDIARMAEKAQETQPALAVKTEEPKTETKPAPVKAMARKAGPVLATAPAPAPQSDPASNPGSKGKSYQINFRASEKVTQLIDKLSREYGSTRALIGHLLKNAGHDVDESDLSVNPFGPRRRNLG